MVKTPKTAGSIDAERARISALIRAYGSLLTQRQRSLALQFCNEGKNFSQIAREREVSRQAIHEAIRSVQQQLELFESKLGLVRRNNGWESPPEPINQLLLDRLKHLRDRAQTGEFDRPDSRLVWELDQILEQVLSHNGAAPLPDNG